ncbi:MAG TPA: hypothetical protein VLE99_02180 [Candidatus Saccharimonadales bacterium]|nr:hypothetical protein [Candidatus Saccharimonadales bacterium]
MARLLHGDQGALRDALRDYFTTPIYPSLVDKRVWAYERKRAERRAAALPATLFLAHAAIAGA